MENALQTALSEFLQLLKDREWHELYEFHEKFRLSPVLILDGLKAFQNLEIIERDGNKIRLIKNLTNSQLAQLNHWQKTRKPDALRSFEQKFLPRWQHRV